MNRHPRELVERDPGDLTASERAHLAGHLGSCEGCRAYAQELQRNDGLLARRESRVVLPPMRSSHGLRVGWTPIAAAALALVVVVTAIGISREHGATSVLTPPSPSVSALTSGTPAGSPSPSALPTPSTAPISSATPTPLASGGSGGLGTLRGNWIFAGKFVPDHTAPKAQVEIWGIPLDGGSPKVAFAYTVVTAGIPEATFDINPYLRRQLSPDGTRLVFSADGQLFIVDLASGQSRALGVTGKFPSWSKDGTQIAYIAEKTAQVPVEARLAVVAATGGTPRELATVTRPGESAEWSPDGSTLLVVGQDAATAIDVANGRLIQRIPVIPGAGASYVQWRAGRPQLALSNYSCDHGNATLSTLETAQSTPHVVFDAGAGCDRADVRDPRWNPANPDEIVVVVAEGAPVPTTYTTRIVDTSTGRSADVGARAFQATWTWDGGSIAYLAKAAAPAPFSDAVVVRSRTGSAERELLRASGDDYFFSIASVAY